MAAKKKVNPTGNPDDEFSLQPLSSEATTSKTHRAPNARDQILSQIHAQPAEPVARPDLPPDAPEYEPEPAPPRFTTMSLLRTGVLFLILIAVSIFVFDIFRHEFGRPITPTAPPVPPPTVAEMTKPMTPETPPAPAVTVEAPKPIVPAKPALPAKREPAPELGTIQEELLSPYELSLKKSTPTSTDSSTAASSVAQPTPAPSAIPPPNEHDMHYPPPPTAKGKVPAQSSK